MFGKKNAKKEETVNSGQELKAKIDQDLLVRNMPSLNRMGGSVVQISPAIKSGRQTSGSSLNLNNDGNKHQKIGMLIIIGGLILIIGLVYLSYVFVIKPFTVSRPVVQESAPSSTSPILSEEQIITEEINISSSSAVAEISPTTLEIEENLNSDNVIEEKMPEEESLLEGADLPPLIDTDSDGLNDDEEAVLGTDSSKSDTNDNTYPDLLEIRNDYNPAGTGRLAENSNLIRYTDNFFEYSLLYPKDWEFSLMDNNRLLVFYAPDDSLIQVYIQENSSNEDIADWYFRTFPGRELLYDKVKIKDSWEGIENPNSRNVYLTDNNRKNIYIVSYIPAVTDRVAYPNIFNLMVDSLSLPLN